MKKVLLNGFLLIISSFFSLATFSQLNIHYWDFNAGNTGTANNQWPSPVSATLTSNSGVLTHNITKTENFAGITLDAPGFTTVNAGGSFSIVDFANNGNSMILDASTAGFQNIRFSYATRGTSTGFTTHDIYYSLDGTTYTLFTTLTGRNNTTFTLQTADFTAITGANNNPLFKIKITFSGATSGTGNNRLDNIRVYGDALTSNAASITASTNGSEPTSDGNFTVTLTNAAPAGGVTVNYTLSGTATSGLDYTNATTGSVTIPQGGLSANVVIDVNDDATPEPNESVTLTLNSATNGYNVTGSPATIAIADNDAPAGILNTNYDFNSCSQFINTGFKEYSMVGAQTWACTKFGLTYVADPTIDSAIQMSGFATTSQNNEDWFISPAFNLTGTNVPLLKFYSRTAFTGNGLVLKVSTDYSGAGNPNLATWTDINGKFPAEASNVWQLSDSINLSAYKQSSVHIAWVYTSTTAAAARWTLDDVMVFNSTVVPSPSVTVNPAAYDFGYIPFGSSSAWKQFTFSASDLVSNLTITAPAGFQLSKDTTAGNSTTLTYTIAEAQPGTKVFYTRFTPDQNDMTYYAGIRVSSTGLDEEKSVLSATSLSTDKTLEVVNWNLSWFGKDETPSDPGPWGPANEDLQEANVLKVLRTINADVYAVVEVCDTMRLRRVVDSLNAGTNNWNFVVCNYGSGADNPADPNYAAFLPTAQKEAMIYKTNVVSVVTARPFLRNSSNYDSTRYYWSSGRVPYLVEANVTLGAVTKRVNLFILHAKANTGTTAEKIESYRRRKLGVLEMKDSIETYYGSANNIILGDFNDDMDRTIAPITTGPDTVSSYFAMVADSIDADHYKTLSLILSKQGRRSTVTGADMIDHVIISNEMTQFFINNTVQIRTDVVGMVATSPILYADSTTDHYPIFTRYNFLQVLPVQLINFTAKKEGAKVKLEWSTAQEFNSRYFSVERSTNGQNWTSIARVDGAGTSNTLSDYSAYDYTPLKPVNLYRIKQMDWDGKVFYSDARRISYGQENKLLISPIPAHDFVNIDMSQFTNAKKVIQLLDNNGKMIMQVNSTDPIVKLNVSSVAKGMYVLRIRINEVNYSEKIIVE